MIRSLATILLIACNCLAQQVYVPSQTQTFIPEPLRVALEPVAEPRGGPYSVPVSRVFQSTTPPSVSVSSPAVARPSQTAAVVSAPRALQFCNALRARRGLPPFQYDARLQASADQKAQIQAQRGRMGHLIRSMPPGARGEGVGASSSPAQFLTCYQYSDYTHGAASSVQGRDGRWYHALLVSGSGSRETVGSGGGGTGWRWRATGSRLLRR